MLNNRFSVNHLSGLNSTRSAIDAEHIGIDSFGFDSVN